MLLTDYFLSEKNIQWDYAKQCGVNHAVVRLPEDDAFDLTNAAHWRQVYDRFTKNKLLLVNTATHRVYGQLFGTVKLDDGRTVRVDGMPFFCEHAKNRW